MREWYDRPRFSKGINNGDHVMRVIWKRPDGNLDASPADFKVLELDGHSKIWLHKTDKEHYPFQVSSGWNGQEDTTRLNNMVNLIPESDEQWLAYLNRLFSHMMKDDPKEFAEYLAEWIDELSNSLKGDTWEMEILSQAIHQTRERLSQVSKLFLAANAR